MLLVVTSQNKLKNVLGSSKSKLSPNDVSGIYCVQCMIAHQNILAKRESRLNKHFQNTKVKLYKKRP